MNTSIDESPCDPAAPPHSPVAARPTGLMIALIAAASLLLLSMFLPWSTLQIHLQDMAAMKDLRYGNQTSVGNVVTLAGMAALTLAFMVRAVSRRFAAYTAVPCGLVLVATVQYGLTYAKGNGVLHPSLTWGYWLTVAMAVAVVALSLATARWEPATDRDQS